MVFINNYNEFLAQTRLRQGRDFDELSISSGVAVPHLKAIEKANTHPFYSRAYYERCVMKYAKALGVDEEVVLEQPTQSELDLEPEAARPVPEASARLSASQEDDGLPPLPAELFASRGPLVPPAAAQSPRSVESPKSATSPNGLKPEAAMASVAEPVAPTLTVPQPTSLDEILPPKLDMTPPKPGFGFPIFLVVVGVALAVVILAWQHLEQDSGTVAVAQQAEKSGAADSKANETAPATPVVVDETPKLKAEIERDLALWAKYWSERNAAGHLSFFDNSFPEFQKYADNRRKRIAAAQSIEVGLSDVVIEKRSDDEFAVRFVQSYRSDSYASKDAKELIWKKTAAGMRIVSERVLK